MYNAYNQRVNINIANITNLQNDGQYNPNYLVSQCNGLTNEVVDTTCVDEFFNQESPYKFPQLVICNDVKRINQNADIYQKYSDIIYDECGNRFNIRNLKDSAGLLQAGYSTNIDLDSHLKNINFYGDKCFYDNWKKNPNGEMPLCDGLKRNANILVQDYTPVGKHNNDCIGNCTTSNASVKPLCNNTPPTDLNCETDIRKRYDFSNNKFKTESCIKPADWVSFKKAPAPTTNNLSKYPNSNFNANRNVELLSTINKGVEHEYYKFFEDTKCVSFPNQRLFNNITKAKCLPSHHFKGDIGPKYMV